MRYDIQLCIVHPDNALQPIPVEEFPDALTAMEFVSDPPETIYEKMAANPNIFLGVLEDNKLLAFSICAVEDDGNIYVMTQEGVFSNGERQERTVLTDFNGGFLSSYGIRDLYQDSTAAETAESYLGYDEYALLILSAYLKTKKFWPSAFRGEQWKINIQYLIECVQTQTLPNVDRITLGSFDSRYKMTIFNNMLTLATRAVRGGQRIQIGSINFYADDLREFKLEVWKLVPVVDLALAIYLSWRRF